MLRIIFLIGLILLPHRTTALDIQIDGIAAPGVPLGALFSETHDQSLEFVGGGYIIAPPCLVEGYFRSRLELRDNARVIHSPEVMSVSVIFAEAELEVVFHPFPESPDYFDGPRLVLHALGSDFELRWNTEWGGLEFENLLHVVDHSALTNACRFEDVPPPIGGITRVWGSAVDYRTSENNAILDAAIRADNALGTVLTAHTSWSRVKAMYQ